MQWSLTSTELKSKTFYLLPELKIFWKVRIIGRLFTNTILTKCEKFYSDFSLKWSNNFKSCNSQDHVARTGIFANIGKATTSTTSICTYGAWAWLSSMTMCFTSLNIILNTIHDYHGKCMMVDNSWLYGFLEKVKPVLRSK